MTNKNKCILNQEIDSFGMQDLYTPLHSFRAKLNQLGNKIFVTYWILDKNDFPIMETLYLDGIKSKEQIRLICLNDGPSYRNGYNDPLKVNFNQYFHYISFKKQD